MSKQTRFKLPSIQTLAIAFRSYIGPGQLYRSVYKAVSCGPSVAMEVDGITICNDALYGLGNWAEFGSKHKKVTSISLSSIVEGVNQCTTTHKIRILVAHQVRDDFWAAVKSVNREAEKIWNDTHGCKVCAKLWADNIPPEAAGEDGITPVHPKCPGCGGHGCVI